MMMYKHVKTGVTAEVVGTIEDGVTLKDVETGLTLDVKNITLRRWWEAVESDAAATPEAPEEIQAETEIIETTETEGKPEIPEETQATAETSEDDTEKEEKPLTLSEIISKLESLFGLLNGLYFEGKLPQPIITVQSTPRAYGHCSTKKIWNAGKEDNGQYEINIGAEYLNRPSENTAATMLHEMVHLYCLENGLTDTCQNGRYHNKLFKQEAEARDLIIGYDRAKGYSATTPSEIFIAKLRENGYALEVPFARNTLKKKGKSASRIKAHAYVCPCCGQTVRTTGELSLICGFCKVEMERAD